MLQIALAVMFFYTRSSILFPYFAVARGFYPALNRPTIHDMNRVALCVWHFSFLLKLPWSTIQARML